jgi:peptide/nickel transport system ATP-binding protein
MTPLIETRNIVKTYTARTAGLRGSPRRRTISALAGVDLVLRRGETEGLVGESGSGKSTLARILLALEDADSGSLTFEGSPLEGPGKRSLKEFRRRVQIVFQDSAGALDPRMSAGESVEEGLANLGLPREEREERSRAAFEDVGLPPARRLDYPHQFSGGERQRIAIARAITMRPDYIVLDECTASLDLAVQEQIVELLVSLKERLGLGYLFVSHDLDLIVKVSDRIAVMHEGRIVEEDGAARMIHSPQHEYTRELFDSMN